LRDESSRNRTAIPAFQISKQPARLGDNHPCA
jgi:hypothetical protein